jgi:Fe-S oxidoreductase/nitrate reductase gamma subunit
MNSLTRFWTAQEVYIMKVFLPIILGFLVLFIGLLAISALSFWWRHYRLWFLGKEENRSDQGATRLKTLLAVTFGHIRFWKELYPGTMHFLIFWGAILIFLGKIVRLFSYPVGLTNPPQDIFKYASFVSEVGGLLVIIGGCMAIYRRYIVKPSRLETKPTNTLIYSWGAVLLMTGYFIKGYRIAIIGSGVVPDWLSWAPVSYFISRFFLILPTEPLNELLIWHRVLIHALPAFLFFAYVFITRTPLQHFFLSPINVFFRSLKLKGILTPIPNFEEAETFGVKEISEYTWKQLLDLEACTNCGRCQDVCPAHLSQKPLSPRRMTQNLKDHLRREGPKLLATPPEQRQSEAIMEKTVGEDELWACTNCMACEEACPVCIEQISRNIELRRYLVLVETKYSSDIRLTLKNLEKSNNPWGMARGLRTDWAKDLGVNPVRNSSGALNPAAEQRGIISNGVKIFSEVTDPEILFWVGCCGSFDARNQKVATSMVKILQASGIRFGILGNEEGCCGDPARRIGNEYLYQTTAEANIGIMKGYGVKKILTLCPHCFHILKNEYPQLGGDFQVIHHTEFLMELIASGRLKLTKPINKAITYHDSCYLGRANQIFEPPRKIIQSIPGLRLIEMKRNYNQSFCCGAGGGRMWMEEHIGTRINQMRTDHAIDIKAELIGTACPYCLTMLFDGIKEKGKSETMAAYDLSELVDQSM